MSRPVGEQQAWRQSLEGRRMRLLRMLSVSRQRGDQQAVHRLGLALEKVRRDLEQLDGEQPLRPPAASVRPT